MRIQLTGMIGGLGAALMITAATLGQSRAGDAQPPQAAPQRAPQTAPQSAPQSAPQPGDVQITLRPVGDGRYEVYVDGNRLEGRLGERLMRAMQDQRGDGPRRPMPGENGGGPDRPMRQGRGPQGDDAAGGPPPPGSPMDGPEGDELPAFRQRLGQYYDGPVPELTDELLDEVMAVIRDFDEALYTRLTTALETNREAVKGRLQNDLRRWMAAVELKRNDPELYELNVKDRQYAHETSRLAGEYAAARRQNDTARMESIRGQLEDLVGKHFDVRQKLREKDLGQLEQRLAFLRTQVQQRLERRAEIISDHLNQLFGGPEEQF